MIEKYIQCKLVSRFEIERDLSYEENFRILNITPLVTSRIYLFSSVNCWKMEFNEFQDNSRYFIYFCTVLRAFFLFVFSQF